MVKAVMTEDYYGDLQVAPNADINEIKRQFKKLALTYHPDRNPGREQEVTAQFQKISHAHEVLTDPQEKAKYDQGRRPNGRFAMGGGNQRGNPYSGVSSQFPKPPSRTNAGARAPPPPPPSAGAQRYKGFKAPKQSAYHASQEGPEARKNTYEAWENMKNNHRSHPTAPKAHNVPPKGASHRDREEPGGFRSPQSPRAQPAAPGITPDRRDQGFGSGNRRTGFTPATPGADETAAPGAYSTTSRKSAVPPAPPPRHTPAAAASKPEFQVPLGPLNQFGDKTNVRFEPRHSTPYSTHGGEKLNPFENGDKGGRLASNDTANMNRSKSTRDRTSSSKNSSPNIQRAGSDSNLNSNSPSQGKPYHEPRRTSTKPKFQMPVGFGYDTSSSDSGPEMHTMPPFTRQDSRPYAKPRSTRTSLNPDGPATGSSSAGDQSSNSQDRVPSTASAQANGRPANTEPSMYAEPSAQTPIASASASKSPSPNERRSSAKRSSSISGKPPTVSERLSVEEFLFPPGLARSSSEKTSKSSNASNQPFLSKNGTLPMTFSGVTGPRLFETEKHTYSVLDSLLNNKSNGLPPFPKFGVPYMPRSFVASPSLKRVDSKIPTKAPAANGSPIKKQKSNSTCYSESKICHRDSARYIRNGNAKTNYKLPRSFTIPVDETTFQQPEASTRNSTENINTRFTPDDWNGKFEGGGYFQPEQKAAKSGQRPRTRTQSGSRSRGRSPIKARTAEGPNFTGESHIPAQSPSSATFSPEEWANTFREQTFMPPPPPQARKTPRPARKQRGSVPKPTMGGAAALVDESDDGYEKPLFAGLKSYTAEPPSPDAMDVDTPPTTKPSTPPAAASQPVPQASSSDPVSPMKRPAARSRDVSPVDTELKVNFEDLSVRDLISSLNLPAPPAPPVLPEAADPSGQLSQEAYQHYLLRFQKYMEEWDLYTSRIILHMFARKKQNDNLGTMRWMEDLTMDAYRLGLREDQVVLEQMALSQNRHQQNVKNHAIMREKMKGRDVERPRKKQS